MSLRARRPHRAVASSQSEDRDAVALSPLQLAERLADGGRARLDGELRQELTDLVLAREIGRSHPSWDNPAADREQVEHPRGEADEAERGDREHRQLVQAVALGDAVHDEVGGRADQGHGSTQDGGEGERHEIARRSLALLIGQREKHRQEDHDDGRVVQERRGPGDDQTEDGEPHLGRAERRGERPPRDRRDHARLYEAETEDQHRGHRDRRRVAETGDRFGGRDDASHQENHGDSQGDLVDRVAFAHEQRERHRDNDENEGDFPGHTRAHRR